MPSNPCILLRLTRAVHPRVCDPLTICRMYKRTWTKLIHQNHCLPQVLHHLYDVAHDSATMSPYVLHRNCELSSDMVKPLYFYGYYLVISRPISWNDLTKKLTQELMASQEAFPDGILYTTDLQSSIPELPPKKLWGDLQCAACNFHQNMPNPERSLIIMADRNTTSIGYIFHTYHQHLKARY